MKIVLLLIFGFASAFGGYFENSKYEAVPQADGSFRLMTKSEVENILSNSTNLINLQVKFYLFTRRNLNEGQLISLGDTSSLARSNFNSRNPTRFITHGWRNDANALINKLVRNAYLQRSDYNIFVVDWGSGAQTNNYVTAKNCVENVGKIVAQFIDFLNQSGGLSFNTLYLIGHSLGAHASGFAGKNVKRGRINTIIGLDPALPLFSINNPKQRLDISDALYVETIHTNGDKLGIYDPIGTTSFYPNWGKKQPGCGMDLSGGCSHSRSYELYAESIKNGRFTATGCNNFDEIKSQKCSKKVSNVKLGGEPSNYGKARGIYYLPTFSQSPYAVS